MATKKIPYSPPKLERHEVTVVGKHQTFDISASIDFDEPHDVAALMAEFGSPLFVTSEQVLRAQYRSFVNTFTAAGIDTKIAYSYKTNYLPAICAVLHEEGAMAEVVSGMEYDLARSLGVKGKNIVFNGPFKTAKELKQAIRHGALINIDSFDELKMVSEIAAKLKKKARIGIRVNFQFGNNSWTKFGLNIENGDSHRALKIIAADKNLIFEAFHNHSGTFHVNPKVYGRAATLLINEVKKARKLGLAPTTLDFGGGYPSENRLKPIYDAPDGKPLVGNFLTEFAEVILNKVLKNLDLFEGRPIVIFEPGRAVVDSCMRLFSSVVSSKDIPGKGRAVVIDAGVNILPIVCWYDFELEVSFNGKKRHSGKAQPTTVYGPLCMQIDVIRDNIPLPPLDIGSTISISNVGAYCVSQSMQFIQPRPAIVMLGKDGPNLIRRAETWRDMFSLDQIPKHLQNPNSKF